MADVHKSANQTTARTRAREKAAEFRSQQDKLEQLATDYFIATDSLEEIEASAQKEIVAVRERTAKRSAAAQANADALIASMLALGTPRSEVADRLGIPTRDVKKLPVDPDEMRHEDTKTTETVPVRSMSGALGTCHSIPSSHSASSGGRVVAAHARTANRLRRSC